MASKLQVVVMASLSTALSVVEATAGQGTGSSVEAELRALNRQAAEMQMRHDVGTATRLLADEYIFVQADGQVTNKAQNLAVIGSAEFVCESLITSDVEVRLYGETALVIGRASMKATFRGQNVGGEFRYTDVWVKRQGAWQNVASQATLLPKNER